MNAAAGLAPGLILANQVLRLRRFSPAAFIASNIILYAVIRSGFNLRFRKPSLTRVQMLVAIGAQGQVLGCFEVTADITDHKLAMQRIQRVADRRAKQGARMPS